MAGIKDFLKTRGGKVGAAILVASGAITAGVAYFGDDETPEEPENVELSRGDRAILHSILRDNDPITQDTTEETIRRNRDNTAQLYSDRTLGDLANVNFITQTYDGVPQPALTLWASKHGDYGLEYASTVDEAEANAMMVCAYENEQETGVSSEDGCEIVRSTLAGVPQCLTYSFQETMQQVTIGSRFRHKLVPEFMVNVTSTIPSTANKLASSHYKDTRIVNCNFDYFHGLDNN